jgi:hypothetical protein
MSHTQHIRAWMMKGSAEVFGHSTVKIFPHKKDSKKEKKDEKKGLHCEV